MSFCVQIDRPRISDSSFTSLGLGVFDGYHIGHQSIGNKVEALLTFNPHPALVLKKKEQIPCLSSLDELRELFENTYCLTFTEELSKLSAEDFLNKVILEQTPAKKIVVGYDFKFGFNRQGDAQLLIAWGQRHNIDIEIVDEVFLDGKAVHSSLIRQNLQQGEFSKAQRLLGHPYLIRGTVIKGEGRGGSLGFPTANMLVPSNKCLPQNGVYKGFVRINDIEQKAMIYIGSKPTFNGLSQSIEVHILDFSKNIYDQTLSVYMTGWIRDQKKFDTKQALVEQITDDIRLAYD
jgi:riboflavin kinase/FMN adenylyltransferase